MRYQVFRLQQESLIELGLNVEDALLLDWLLNWKDGNSMDRLSINNNDVAYWVNYGKVIEELPILFKQVSENAPKEEIKKAEKTNTAKIARMLKGNLSKILTRHEKKFQGKTKIYISFDRNKLDLLINGNKKATAGTVTKENIKSNNSICEANTDYTSNTKENEVVKNVKEAKKELSEVAKVIDSSNVNIKKSDIKECEELFTNIDKLKASLVSMQNTNSHGLKALKMAYTKSDNNNNTNKPKTKFHNLKNESFKNYSDEELEEIIQRNQAKKFTPRYKL